MLILAAALIAQITVSQVRQDVSILADDSMHGRLAPSADQKQTANFLAVRLRAAGITPSFQTYAMRTVTIAKEAGGFTYEANGVAKQLDNGEHIGFPFNDWPRTDTVGPVYHVSFDNIPDTTRYRGAVLIVSSLGDYERMRGWHPAAVFVAADIPAANIARMAARNTTPRVRNPDAGAFLSGVIVRRVADSIPNGARARVWLKPDVVYEDSVSNVIGIIPGSDPKLRDEYVVLSAHMDHLGMMKPATGPDSIYNGADDNASGTAAILEAAISLARGKAPRRSIMVVFFGAEEQTGWGAKSFVRTPYIPLSKIKANLNADMVGRPRGDSLWVIGSQELRARNAEGGLTIVDHAIDPKWPDLTEWSDHAQFKIRNIPYLYFFTGMHEDYHRVTDSADKLNYEMLARVSRLIAETALDVANR
ncbi:MAG TPA: M20/M25/M40 family metallo-hydrolase [Longimicrobiales bacterium]|nr:M20/M25/M40 family metallo-hydrolase [Longimicrobiales bacterium]